jgi:lipopolysaccharide transport system permease protein
MTSQVGDAPSLVIRPSRGWRSLRLAELWDHRDLIIFLTWRDVMIRYKQAVLGVAWAVLQPFLTMVVFTVIFGGLLNVNSGSVPYAVFSLAGLLPWQLFASGLQRSGVSLVGNANLLTKVYFPRLSMPISAVLAGLPDFFIALGVLAVLMVLYHVDPSWRMLWLPLLVLLTVITTLAVSLWLAALNVLYRDVQYIIPFLIQLGMFISPVVYSASMIPSGPMRVIYGLNPMAGVIVGFRWALVDGPPPDSLLAVSVVSVIALFVGGTYFFRRMERVFADIV